MNAQRKQTKARDRMGSGAGSFPHQAVIEIRRDDALCMERLALCLARLREIASETEQREEDPFAAYFQSCTSLLLPALLAWETGEAESANEDKRSGTGEAALLFRRTGRLCGSGYAASYANPRYAKARCGEAPGALFSVWMAELCGLSALLLAGRLSHIAAMAETMIQLYNAWTEDGAEGAAELKNIVYSYLYDYSAEFTEDALSDGLLPQEPGLPEERPRHLIERLLFGNGPSVLCGTVCTEFAADHAEDGALFLGDRLRAELLRALAAAKREGQALPLRQNRRGQLLKTEEKTEPEDPRAFSGAAQKPDGPRYTVRQRRLLTEIQGSACALLYGKETTE